jgi:hypothetical protein
MIKNGFDGSENYIVYAYLNPLFLLFYPFLYYFTYNAVFVLFYSLLYYRLLISLSVHVFQFSKDEL